eukprot:6799603-Pyramimonas_sp.AAC.1
MVGTLSARAPSVNYRGPHRLLNYRRAAATATLYLQWGRSKRTHISTARGRSERTGILTIKGMGEGAQKTCPQFNYRVATVSAPSVEAQKGRNKRNQLSTAVEPQQTYPHSNYKGAAANVPTFQRQGGAVNAPIVQLRRGSIIRTRCQSAEGPQQTHP